MHPALTPTRTPPSPTPFSPSDEVISQILSALPNPDTTLRDLAERFETSLDALTLFLARPDIAARLAAMDDAFAARARLVATAHLPTVAHMLTRMIDDHLDEAAHIPVNPKSLPAIEQRRRSRETARRAANLLLRIAKFQAGPTASPSPTPRGTGVPPVRSSRRPTSPPQSPTALPSARRTNENPPRRHAEDEAPPQSLPSRSPSTPNPRVSPSPASLSTSSCPPLSLRERPGEGSCLDLPSSYMPSALDSPSPYPTSSEAPSPNPHITSPTAPLPTSSSNPSLHNIVDTPTAPPRAPPSPS